MEKGKASSHYLDFFGLEREPFSDGYERAFYFQDPELTQRLGMLQHFSRYSDLLLMVIGEHGVGKSALLKRFTADLPATEPACEIQATTMMDASGLLQAIAQRCHLNPGAAQSIEHLLGALKETQHPDETLLLIVDDAHEMSVEAMHTLFKLAEAGSSPRKLLKVIMFCEPAIEQMLTDPSIAHLSERITHILELNPFDEEQTGLYIQHRLRTAGLPGANPIDEKLSHRIYRHSGGNPGRINKEVVQIMRDLARSGGKLGDHAKTLQYAFASVILAAIMVAAYVMKDRLLEVYHNLGREEVAQVEVDEPALTTVVIGPDGEVEAEEQGEEQQGQQRIPVLKGFEDEVEEKPGDDVDPHTIQAVPEETQVIEPTGHLDEPKVKISSVNPNPVIASAQRQEVVIHGEGFTRGSRVTVGWTGSVAELARWQVKYISDKELRIRIATGTEADTWTVRVLDQNNQGSNVFSFRVIKPSADDTAVQAQGDATAFTPQLGQELTWITLQNGKHFTLQLFASDKEANVVAFIKKYGLQEQAAYFQSQRNGKPWYTLIYGQYPSRDTAETEAKQISERIPGVKPWIRRFADIQAQLPSAEIRNSAWIRQQNSSHYALQLLVSSDRAKIEAYVKQNGLQNTAVYSAVRNGKTLYILIQGVYTSRDQADLALARLPQEVREARPWVRSYASLQRDIANNP